MHLGADGQALAGGAQAQELHLRRLLIGNRLLARGLLHEARVAYARRRPLPTHAREPARCIGPLHGKRRRQWMC